MRVHCCGLLGFGPRRGFADELCLFNGSYGLPNKILFVVDNGDILFCEVANLVVCNFPKFFRNLRDEAEVVRDDYYAAFEVFDSTSEGINRCHVQMIGGLIWKPSVIRIPTLEPVECPLTEKEDVRVLHRKLGEDNTKQPPC
jgi:hypothetical protein